MRKLLLIAATALWFAGCSERGEGGGDPREGVAIAFSLDCGTLSASVGAAPAALAIQPVATVASAAQPAAQPAQAAPQPAPQPAASPQPAARNASPQPPQPAPAARNAVQTRAVEPIASGTTVRIVALYKGDPLGSTPAASATYYVTGEETADGHLRAKLAPCSVTNDATTGAVTGYTADASKAMRLKAGKYDFYAYSPALPLKSDSKSVDVYHGMDFAASKTEGVVVNSDGSTSYPDPTADASPAKTGAAGAVELKTLVRRCSFVSFSVEPKTASAFSKLSIESVLLTKMTDQPADTAVGAAIVPVGNSYSFEFPPSAFKPGTAANLWSFESPVLPKIEDTYGLAIKVLYNENTTPVTLETADNQIPAMEFLAGYRYSFSLKLKGPNLQLILTVSDWNDAGAWEDPDGIGAYPGMSFTVGEWADCFNDNTGIGGFLNPEFTTPENWTENPNLNDEIGAFLEVVSGGADAWVDRPNDNTDTGL